MTQYDLPCSSLPFDTVFSIPTFLFGGKMIANGAVKSDELVRIFRGIERSGESADGSLFADVLGIPASVMETQHIKL